MPTQRRSARAAPSPRRVARAVVATAVVVVAFGFGLPQFASVADVAHALGHVTWRSGAVLAAVATWNLVTYWLVWIAAMPGLGLRRAAMVTSAPTALANTVPAGSYFSVALTYAILRSFGHDRAAATTALVVTGLWNNFAKLAAPLVALIALALDGEVEPDRVVAAAFGIVVLTVAIGVFAGVLRSGAAATFAAGAATTVAAPLARLFRRRPPSGWGEALDRLRQRTASTVATRWHWITLATGISHLSLYAVLLASLRATGAEGVSAAEVLAVFAFARLVTALPVTPGGVGVVEFTLTAALVAAGGDRVEVVAGVVAFRALTYLVPIALGAVAYLLWRRDVRDSSGSRLLAGASGAGSAQAGSAVASHAPSSRPADDG